MLRQLLRDLNTNLTLNNYLFGFVELTKNVDPAKYKYSGYSVGFDSRSEFSFTDGNLGKCHMSSSVHIDNKNKYILILGEGPAQGLDDTTSTEWAKYPVNFITQSEKRFVLSLHYNQSNGFLFANATKIYQFKAKDSEIKDYTLCLGNISEEFTINNMKKTQA